MKKHLLFLTVLAALAATGSAFAQDTVDCLQTEAHYLYDSLWVNIKSHSGFSVFDGPEFGGEFGKRYIVDDSLTIYGIAAGVVDMATVFQNSAYENNYANSIEYLRLYRSQGDTLFPLVQVPIHMNTTPVSYYVHLQCPDFYPNSSKYSPMYERYFNSPITVYDSFYAGMTFFIERQYMDNSGTQWDYRYPALGINRIAVSHEDNVSEWIAVAYRHTNADNSFYNNWTRGRENDRYTMIFPVLLPHDSTTIGNDDTVLVGGDTVAMGDTLVVTDTLVIGGDTIVTCDTLLAVVQADMLARLTGVMPNPAATTAKVVSSFGLTRIEVYSSTGARVYDRPASGLAATLDVSRWPSGTYILRIHTPMGVATKRLAVAR